jgi:tRNA(Met) cytidine acetyltransferase
MSALGRLLRSLRREARRTNERRALVLNGSRQACYEYARQTVGALDLDPEDVTLVSERAVVPTEPIDPTRTDSVLGSTTPCAVFDTHDTCQPNALGQVVGAVDGGGVFVLLAPALAEWPALTDGFDASLVVPPADTADVSGAFRERLVSLLRAHRGIAIVDADTGVIERPGLTHPASGRPTDAPSDRGHVETDHVRSIATDRPPTARDDAGDEDDDSNRFRFPPTVFERCLTADQARCVRAFEDLIDRPTKRAVVAEADRGRGKSSAAGLAAGAFVAAGRDVLVTAPDERTTAALFDRARAVLASLDVPITNGSTSPTIATESATLRFARPTHAASIVRSVPIGDGDTEAARLTRGDVDPQAIDAFDPAVVFVDEAAGLPVGVLEQLLATDRIAFVTTVHGYEGAGRGFAVRFRERLAASSHTIREIRLDDPIRYAAGDPLEVWVFRALLLDARPAVDPLVEDASPETVRYERVSGANLAADEGRLREVFGLLVAAHYRTEPNDLARLLCGPTLSVRALTHRGHVVAVCLLASEGGLPESRRRALFEGGRINGHLLPDLLTSQLQDLAAGDPRGLRVVRIAAHGAVRSRGLGSELLDSVREECLAANRGDGRRPVLAAGVSPDRWSDHDPNGEEPIDWLGVAYGATPRLLRFWRSNGFRTVHVSTTRNDRSGEHSALMLDALTDTGRALTDRHTRWFAGRFPAVLSDTLSDLDPDVARGALRGVGEHVAPRAEFTARDWRIVRGVATGTGLYDTDPRPLRRLARVYFTDRATTSNSPASTDGPNRETSSGPDSDADSRLLSTREERLLIARVFQARPPAVIAADLEYASRRQCLRALGAAYRTLLDRYGPNGPKEFDGTTD